LSSWGSWESSTRGRAQTLPQPPPRLNPPGPGPAPLQAQAQPHSSHAARAQAHTALRNTALPTAVVPAQGCGEEGAQPKPPPRQGGSCPKSCGQREPCRRACTGELGRATHRSLQWSQASRAPGAGRTGRGAAGLSWHRRRGVAACRNGQTVTNPQLGSKGRAEAKTPWGARESGVGEREGLGPVGWEPRDGDPAGPARRACRLPSPHPLRGRSLQTCQGGDPAGQGGPASSRRKSQPRQLTSPGARPPPQSGTHVGEGELAEHRVVALLLHLLHQRADHQLGVQACKPSGGRLSRQRGERPQPSSRLRPVLPPEMRAVELCATARTSWV